jgi:hypothetical protein
MKKMRSTILITFVLALVAAAGQHSAEANSINGSVTLSTSGLSGLFELAFIFTDGSGSGDANNSVTLNTFQFGEIGSPGTVDTLLSTGGQSGSLATGVALIDSAFLNVFASTFEIGGFLFFKFSFTTNVDAGGTPDQLSFALLHDDGSPVNTVDPSGADSLLTVNLDSAHPAISTFASDLTPAPIVTLSAQAPEPDSLLLAAACFSGLLFGLRRRAVGRASS